MDRDYSGDSSYSNIHRCFLQTVANFGVIEKNEALNILTTTIKEQLVDDDDENEETNIIGPDILQKIIYEINEKISKYDQKIIEVHYDKFNKDYVIYSNSVSKNINKFQNTLSVNERNYFRNLLKEIAINKNHCVEMIFALNLSSEITDKSLTKKKAEQLIETWIALGYFTSEEDCAGEIYLGPKGIVEFGANLKHKYPDSINKCQICEGIIFYGLCCGENMDCTAIFHRKCVHERLKKFSNCFACKKPWKSST